MPQFDDERRAANAELKRLEKLEKKIANLEKPRSWERFKAFFNGGTKKVLADTKTAKTNLEQDITQKTSPGFLNQYQDWKQRVEREVDRQMKERRLQKANELNDTLSVLGVGGDIKEKPKGPKQTAETVQTPTFSATGPLTLDEVLSHPKMKTAFENFAQREGSPENLRFFQAVEDFKADVKAGVVSIEDLKETARELNSRFVVNHSEEWVTLDNQEAQQTISDAIKNFDDNTTREELGRLFDVARDEVRTMLADGTVMRFQGTDECKQLRAKFGHDGATSENVRNKMNYKGPSVGGSGNKNNLGV